MLVCLHVCAMWPMFLYIYISVSAWAGPWGIERSEQGLALAVWCSPARMREACGGGRYRPGGSASSSPLLDRCSQTPSYRTARSCFPGSSASHAGVKSLWASSWGLLLIVRVYNFTSEGQHRSRQSNLTHLAGRSLALARDGVLLASHSGKGGSGCQGASVCTQG